MTAIPSRLRDQVVQRAGNRCEYCGLSQAGQEAAFHVDHVVPLALGGQHELPNLAISYPRCNIKKNARSPERFAAELGTRLSDAARLRLLALGKAVPSVFTATGITPNKVN